MSKDIYIMPIHISSLERNPKGFNVPHSGEWITHHTVNMDNGDRHIVTSVCFANLKDLLWTTDGHNFRNAVDQQMKERELTTLQKIELLT